MKPVFYKPDGTGRDTYVLGDHGGFMKKYDTRDETQKF